MASQLRAATVRNDAIDDIVTRELKRQFSPGIGLAVVKDGRIVKVKGYGFSNVELRALAGPGTLFQTASVGKQFTAALVMLLVRDGKVQLDDSISTYLPEAPPAWHGITVRHLLTHTSGLVDNDPAIDFRRDYTEQELLSSASKTQLQCKPGAAHQYSNLGYQVLGFICTRVGGRFWGDQLRDRVFVPLGMHTARVMSERDIIPGRAAGYDRYDGVLENQSWVAPSLNTTADGSCYVSASDMARWALTLGQDVVLTQAEWQTIWTPGRLDDGTSVNYGFGWALFRDAGYRLMRHRGDWQGFTSHIAHVPEGALTVVVLMNRARGQPHVIADKILAHYMPALRKPAIRTPANRVLQGTPMFVRRAMNDWKATVVLTAVEPGLLTATLVLPAGMQQFKVGDVDWKLVDLGARFDEAVVKLGQTKTLEAKGEDLFLDVQETGTFLFELDLRGPSAPRLTVRAFASPSR